MHPKSFWRANFSIILTIDAYLISCIFLYSHHVNFCYKSLAFGMRFGYDNNLRIKIFVYLYYYLNVLINDIRIMGPQDHETAIWNITLI